ncbi:cytochrome P450 [Daedalea quercina L-15889]|uniref:Cytochrome P450 n=1 Tax=Daedalea quercina L-15889 TaxID=1314783 RepID=A0A165MIN7_9APHY|nr:cytochrome P450 [Daedalea quercina L-15889]
MTVVHHLISRVADTPLLLLALIPVAFLLTKLIVYLKDSAGLRSYPGPFLAKFTDFWMYWTVNSNRWSSTVDELHKKYGVFVRLSPTHISVSDPRALPVIYGHSTGFTKSSFYDIFNAFSVSNIVSTRSRAEHARKRRIEAHMFAPQSIRAIEPISRVHVTELLRQWDYLASRPCEAQNGGPFKGQLGSSAWEVEGGRAYFNCMDWFNFWSFDTIGDLVFGFPFGMLKSGRDVARVAKNPDEGLKAIEKTSVVWDKLSIEEEEIAYIKFLSTRAEGNASLGWLSPPWRSIAQRLRFGFYASAGRKLAALAIMAVARRIANPDPRPDMLQKLLEARDDDGKPLSPEELSAEAFVLIVAGSDTTANTACGTAYYVARDKRVQTRLQSELDTALASMEDDVALYEAIKDLPYLDAVINEGHRMHSTIGAGLPREVPAGGVSILGHDFKAGTVLSVPVYHVHRNEAVWGPDAAEFRPERWIEASPERKKQMIDAFVPFSIGPRACIGRNLANMQLHIVIATLFQRYDFSLKSNEPLRSRDAFARRPLNCVVGIQRRNLKT